MVLYASRPKILHFGKTTADKPNQVKSENKWHEQPFTPTHFRNFNWCTCRISMFLLLLLFFLLQEAVSFMKIIAIMVVTTKHRGKAYTKAIGLVGAGP